MKLRVASAFTFGSLLALALCTSACGSATNQGGTAGGGDGGAGGEGGGSSTSGSTNTEDTIDTMTDTSTQTGPGFEACAEASAAAATLPLHMYILVDRSGSMGNNNKWTNAKSAFLNYFQDPANTSPDAKLHVALRFWPDGLCNDSACDINACSQPQVPLGPLADPTQVQALIDLYNSKAPGGNTPMYAALGGGAKWAIENAQLGEGGVVTVIILVTDGAPNGCDENINNIASHAANAYATAGVPTFAVGLAGSNEQDMKTIAIAGNTVDPFLIGNANAEAELTAALQEIQKTTLACVFAMPEPTGSDPLDPDLVNLTYTPKGANPITIGKVKGESDCDAAGGWGWYYNDPAKPTVIQLCPKLCDQVQADPDGKIEIVIGCESKPA